MILVNGRLSERSFKRWRRVPGTIAALLRCFDLCLAQSAAHAGRYRDLGAPRIATTGNLKLDVPEPPADPDSLLALEAAIGERTVIAGASTHAGEETMLIEAHRRLRGSFPRLLTIIAPRHPDRGPGILEIAHAAGLKARLRSRGELPEPDTDIYVADTLGELGLIYRLAPIVFVGGSLASHGGQNPIEPIKLGAAILHGPHVWNFAEIYAALDKSHGAEQVTDVGQARGARRRLAQGRRRARRGGRRRARDGRDARRRARAHARRARALSHADPSRAPRRRCVSRHSGGARPAFAAAPAGAGGGGLWRGRGARDCNSAAARAGAPVVCIGNLTVGGAGKTPTALAVARMLAAAGERPAFLTRGYGGTQAGPLQVDPARASRARMWATSRCCWRAPRRPSWRATACKGARLAVDAGASVIVMDDGFQNPSLAKDFSVLVVDARRGIGNGRVIPAGPLRAPLAAQLGGRTRWSWSGPARAAPMWRRPRARASIPVFAARLAAGCRLHRGARRRPGARLCRHRRSGEILRHAAPTPASRSRRRGAFPIIIATRGRRRRPCATTPTARASSW